MLTTSFVALALAATGLAQFTPPEGYRKVYITSMVDSKFVVVPKSAATGSTVVVYAYSFFGPTREKLTDYWIQPDSHEQARTAMVPYRQRIKDLPGEHSDALP